MTSGRAQVQLRVFLVTCIGVLLNAHAQQASIELNPRVASSLFFYTKGSTDLFFALCDLINYKKKKREKKRKKKASN